MSRLLTGDTRLARESADWDEAPLAELGKFKNGINKGADSFGHGFPFVNLMDVFGITRIYDTRTLGLVNSSDIERRNYDLREGDVLFVRSSVKPSGVGLATLVAGSLPDAVFSGFLLRFRSDGRLANSFKAYLFSEANFRNRVIGASTVSANTNINQRSLGSVSIRFPQSKFEQEAIAQALSDADALIIALEKQITKKQAIKQGMMQQLLTGKTRLPGFTEQWTQVKLGAVASMGSGGTPSSKVAKYYGGRIPWVSISDMTSSGKYIRETEKKLTPEGLAASAAKLYDPAVVLYAMYASLGECSLSIGPVTSSQAILGISPGRNLDREFLYYYLTSIKLQVKEMGQQGTQSNLNAGMVRSFALRLPKIAEQRTIATVLSDADRELDSLAKKLQQARCIKQGMMQQLLTGRTRLPVAEGAA